MWMHGKTITVANEEEEGQQTQTTTTEFWTTYQKFLRFYYKIWRALYCSFYYYFMPFLAVLFTYTAKQWTNEGGNSGRGN